MDSLRSYAEFEEFLGRFTNYERMKVIPSDGWTSGIERMRSFAKDLGDPQDAYPSVHMAGTKGKGSTCLILEALLLKEGFRVGTYLSPHVERLPERIRVDGTEVEEGDLVAETNEILPILRRRETRGSDAFPSFFELMTGLAMAVFKRRRVDVAIFEVGLGGRLDATNILRPRICGITAIGLEHTQQLGSTLREIAREKAGIIKPDVPIALGPLPPEAEEEILRIARERGAPVAAFEPALVRRTEDGRLRVADPEAIVDEGPILGSALREDLAIALVILRGLLGGAGRAASADALRRALSGLALPARIERFPGDPPVVIDGGHTPEALRALRDALEETGFPRPRILLFSVAHGKEIARMLREIPRIAEEIIWTRADPVRSVAPGELRTAFGAGTVVESPEDAFRAALARGLPIVVTGSFYLAGRLRPMVRGRR